MKALLGALIGLSLLVSSGCSFLKKFEKDTETQENALNMNNTSLYQNQEYLGQNPHADCANKRWYCPDGSGPFPTQDCYRSCAVADCKVRCQE